MTMTVAVLVWIRPLDSVDGTRWTRWTPPSNLSRLVGAVAGDLEDRLLDAADAGLVEAHEVRAEPVLLRVAQYMRSSSVGEQRGLLAAGAGPDLHDDVAVVVGVAREEARP